MCCFASILTPSQFSDLNLRVGFEQHSTLPGEARREGGLDHVSSHKLSELMEEKHGACVARQSDGSLLLELCFQSLLDITKFWVAYKEEKLAHNLQEFLSPIAKLDQGWELVLSTSIDPVEYADAVARLARREQKSTAHYPSGM